MKKSIKLKLAKFSVLFLFALSALFCSSDSDNSQDTGNNNITSGLSLFLTDDPIDTVSGLWVTIKSIEVYGNGSPKELKLNDEVEQPVNLLDLQNGIFATLVKGNDNENKLPPGKYSGMKIYISSAAITFTDDPNEEKTPAEVPPDKFNLNTPFTITEGEITELYLIFNARNALHQTGNGKYKINPVIHLLEKIVSGSLKGKIDPLPSINNETGEEIRGNVFADQGSENEVSTLAKSDGTFIITPLREGTHTISVEWITLQDKNQDGLKEEVDCQRIEYGDAIVTAQQETDIGTIKLTEQPLQCK